MKTLLSSLRQAVYDRYLSLWRKPTSWRPQLELSPRDQFSQAQQKNWDRAHQGYLDSLEFSDTPSRMVTAWTNLGSTDKTATPQAGKPLHKTPGWEPLLSLPLTTLEWLSASGLMGTSKSATGTGTELNIVSPGVTCEVSGDIPSQPPDSPDDWLAHPPNSPVT